MILQVPTSELIIENHQIVVTETNEIQEQS